MDRLRGYFAGDAKPTADEVNEAFWFACHGGQTKAAEYLLDRGADRNWTGHDGLAPLNAAIRSGNEELVKWLKSGGAVLSTKHS
jgi:ankyrin repeat protein